MYKMLLATLLASVPFTLQGESAVTKGRADLPPRKVIVGTVMLPFWVPYPGLRSRLDELSAILDRLAAESKRKYGRGLDVAVLPETAVTGEVDGDTASHSIPLEGSLKDTFSRKARELHSYLVIPTYLLDDKEKKVCSNAAILFGRNGQIVGVYRKLHPAVHTGSDSMEGGVTPGKEAPVFACDFGKLGIQICYDIEFDYGWDQLARNGADLVVWPTQSPQTVRPAIRARQNGYYIVSSTWRHNASVFEPTGKIVAQIKSPEQVLVQEIDLSWAILPWSPQLKNGEALSAKYGNKVGYRYYEDEDRGMFWSNDPQVTIGQMFRSLDLAEADRELERIQFLYKKAGVPGN
jgi:predicted amidohydrolase